MAERPRIRYPWFAAAVVLLAALAAVAVADPFHLVLRTWFAGLAVGVACLALTGWLLLVARRAAVRVVVATLGILATACWAVLVWAAVTLSPELTTLDDVAGPPGSRVRLAVVEVETWAVDRRTFSVRARAGSGLLAQETQVWAGLGEGARPTAVRFVDERTVEVVGGGCASRSTVDPVTLAVDPEHRC